MEGQDRTHVDPMVSLGLVAGATVVVVEIVQSPLRIQPLYGCALSYPEDGREDGA
jgi:hypothetical protein